MKTLTVSVLMTTYNRERYVAEAIESVLSSTFEDFELVLVDDRSQDATVEIAQSYARQDPRVKVFVNEENLGDYPNRNRAATLSKGAYLKYVDADDMIYPTGLQVLVSMMEQFPESGYGLCSLIQDVERPFPFMLRPAEAYRYHYFGPGLFHRAPLSCIIRRAAFEAVGGFTGKRMVGDFEMWHILSARYPIVLMPDGVVWSRVHDSQEMNDVARYPARFNILYWNVTVEQISQHNCPLTLDERNTVLRTRKLRAARAAVRSLVQRQFRDAKNYFECAKDFDILIN